MGARRTNIPRWPSVSIVVSPLHACRGLGCLSAAQAAGATRAVSHSACFELRPRLRQASPDRRVADATSVVLSLHLGFVSFTEWLKETGPHDVIIDGANVGMHNQSYDGAQINFGQARRPNVL